MELPNYGERRSLPGNTQVKVPPLAIDSISKTQSQIEPDSKTLTQRRIDTKHRRPKPKKQGSVHSSPTYHSPGKLSEGIISQPSSELSPELTKARFSLKFHTASESQKLLDLYSRTAPNSLASQAAMDRLQEDKQLEAEWEELAHIGDGHRNSTRHLSYAALRSSMRRMSSRKASIVSPDYLSNRRKYSLKEFQSPRYSTGNTEAELPYHSIKRSEVTLEQMIFDNCLQVNHFILEKKIGKGTTGVLYSARDTKQDERRAVKIYDKKHLEEKFTPHYSGLLMQRNELNMISQLSHPNIIKAYEVIESENINNVFLVLEAANWSLIEECPMSEVDAWKYFNQLVSVLDYLHNEAKIVHRDLKPRNLMIDSNNKLKLFDFGTAQSIYAKETSLGISATSAFLAPERFLDTQACDGCALDIWGAGVTLFYFIEGCTPFSSRSSKKLSEEISTKSINYSARIQGPLKTLLEKMLEKDPCKRIKLAEVKEEPWLKLGPLKNRAA
mmetsp:Transcript_16578/g.29841  ORF Transcript_16578/g.29841 Transcript_16578/m.29841 type:complete len:499 (+) Transcript_16578:134-1630(+)